MSVPRGASGGDAPARAGRGTRQRILVIAAGLFRRQGYDGTSMRDIAEQLGTTKAALYYHFPRKEDILEALVAPTLAALDGLLDSVDERAVDPGGLLLDVVRVTAAVPVAVAPLDLPDIVRAQGEQFSMDSRLERIARLLAGPAAGPEALLRAHGAVGAMHAGMRAAAGQYAGLTDPGELQSRLEADARVVVGAAVAALRSGEGSG